MPSPIRPPYGPPISFEQAKRAAAAAEAEAKRNGWRVAIAIVEPCGELVHFSKLDDTQYGSISMAISKAVCAARLRRPSKEFSDQFVGGELRSLTLPGAVAAEGGEPIMIDGRIVGAIGVSGATGEEDGVAALAGAKAAAS
jgi:glc operon protein GlcG